MHSINGLELHNLNAIDEVAEANQTDQRGEDMPELLRGHKILGATLSAINRKKIKSRKLQEREARKIRNNFR